jgi:hypothetical protein
MTIDYVVRYLENMIQINELKIELNTIDHEKSHKSYI